MFEALLTYRYDFLKLFLNNTYCGIEKSTMQINVSDCCLRLHSCKTQYVMWKPNISHTAPLLLEKVLLEKLYYFENSWATIVLIKS